MRTETLQLRNTARRNRRERKERKECKERLMASDRLWENEELLQRAGFRSVEAFFKWYNFCGMLALQ